jgi:hypothetical protein
MKLYAQIVNSNETRLSWKPAPVEGWYEIEREPERGEFLEYDKENDKIVIKQRIKSAEQIEAERLCQVKLKLREELPDLILLHKENPADLAQALCDRAKAIEAEISAKAAP